MATLIFFVGAIIFLAWLFGSDHSKPESPYKYEVKNEPPQLPPLNYDVEIETMSDEECLKKFARSSLLIRKEPQGNSNRLYVVE